MRIFRRILPVVLLITMLFATSAYATGNTWYDDYVAYESANENNYTSITETDAAFLAWQEGMLLRSYINLYELTKQTSWLTKFTDHFDIVKGKANDGDGDGYLDWTTARYSPSLASNGNFEIADSGDATLPKDWTRSGSTATTAFRTNAAGNYVSGGACSALTWGLQLTTDGSTLQRLYTDISSYEANLPYNFSLVGKKGGTVDGHAFIYDRTANAVLASITVTSSSWTTYSIDFTAPASGHTLEVWLTHDATSPASASVYYDNVNVTGYYAYQVLDGIIGIPVADFVRLVNENAGTLSSFQTVANTYQDFLEDEIIAKWEDSNSFYGDTWVDASSTEGYYIEPMNHNTFSTPTVLDPLPYNQYFTLIEIQRILYDVNANAAYLDKAEKGTQYFKNNLTTSGSTYTWYYAAFPGSKLEDASHVNVDMEFISEMNQGGSIFTNADMEKFTDTLTVNMWNQSTSSPRIHNFVTGVQGGYCSDYLFTSYMYGWLPFAQFDAQVWDVAARQYDESGFLLNNHTKALTLSEIMKWDPVKLTNQGFELASSSDATLPARWTRFLSTSATAYLDSTSKNSGNYGLTLVSNGSSWQKLTQVWKEYESSENYVLTFDGKTDLSGANGRVWVYNETVGTTIASYNFTNTAWQNHTLTFTAPANATDIVTIQLGHQTITVNNGVTNYDNVSIKKSGDAW
ncbi:MAG: hypothetical protein WDZ91_04790 [Paenibacillaceae bacterium]